MHTATWTDDMHYSLELFNTDFGVSISQQNCGQSFGKLYVALKNIEWNTSSTLKVSYTCTVSVRHNRAPVKFNPYGYAYTFWPYKDIYAPLLAYVLKSNGPTNINLCWQLLLFL